MSLEEYEQVIDVLPEATLLVTGTGLVLAANPAARSLGLHGGGGERFWDLTRDTPEAVTAYLRSCSRTKQLVLGALELRGPGRQRWRSDGALLRPHRGEEEALILLRLTSQEQSVGRFLLLNQRIEALNREVRRRNAVEDQLRAQREWLQVTLTSIGDAVITSDTTGAVTFLNPKAEALTGWGLGEAVGRPLEEVFRIFNEETRVVVPNPVAQVIARGQIVGLANHTVLVARGGAENAIEDTAAPIRGPDGELRGVVLVFHDVGDRRLLERQLHERAERLVDADRRKDDFLAMLAHELRNPLAPILNGLQILGLKGGDAAVVERTRVMMQRQVEHTVRMIDDLMDVSRITRGKIALRLEELDLLSLARLAVEDCRARAAAAGIAITVALPTEPVWITADASRLTQILANLLDNAIKFTDRGGAVTLELAADQDNAAEVRIRDTGLGIDRATLPHIFEAFAQADRTLDRSRGGLGLGLAMVKGLVELHGGTVEATSAGLGKGTEIVVRLLASHSTSSARAPTDASTPRAPRAVRVLIVDDNHDAAESLQVMLGLLGYDVAVAHDGPEGVTAARRQQPDVVLCDIGLPGMDGFAVATALRADPATAGIRLVALTGYGEESMRRRAIEAGFEVHLVKPIDARTILAAIGLQ